MSKQKEKIDVKKMEAQLIKMKKSMKEMKLTISNLNKNLRNANEKLNLYINRKFADVKILNKQNEWEDYSGKFYATDEETDDMLYKKALKHYNTYFKNSDWHRNKHLGIFVPSLKMETKLKNK